MNSTLFKRISTFTIAGFLICIVLLLIFSYDLKKNLIEAGVMDRLEASQNDYTFMQLMLYTGLVAGFGLLSIIFLLAAERYKVTQEQIIVENFSGGMGDKSDEESQQEETEAIAVNNALQEIAKTTESSSDSLDREKIQKLLSQVCNTVNAAQGLFYLAKHEENVRSIELYTSYAFTLPDSETLSYEFGEGIAGQVAKEGKTIKIDQVPQGYITVRSGLGESSPNSMAVFPIVNDNEIIGVVEIATFQSLAQNQIQTLEGIFNKVGERLSSATI